MRNILLVVLLASGLLVVVSLWSLSTPAQAVGGPCGTSHDSVDGEEAQFLQLLQAWRDTHVANSSPLEQSGALNAAAAWFAEFKVGSGGIGHVDNLGRTWVQRAIDCGYDSYYAFGSGEGIYAVSSSSPLNIGPSQALAGITYPSSGVNISAPPSLPAKCVGVAVKRNAAGTSVAWVAVIAQLPPAQACPASTASGGADPSPSASPSPTSTNTPTPTASPTNTPTPSPTPTLRADGAKITLYPGWNLVILPAGPIGEILHRARGCFTAVYQQQGDQWLRYSNDAPPYARNLTTSNGGAFWIEGTAANCGLIPL
jgi:hypothetical protein